MDVMRADLVLTEVQLGATYHVEGLPTLLNRHLERGM